MRTRRISGGSFRTVLDDMGVSERGASARTLGCVGEVVHDLVGSHARRRAPPIVRIEQRIPSRIGNCATAAQYPALTEVIWARGATHWRGDFVSRACATSFRTGTGAYVADRSAPRGRGISRGPK